MANYLGKKISLISKAGIRYEGILYTIDPTEATVALSKVKSFGTEDRQAERPIPPRDEIYEYIIFRGSDIRHLTVCGNSMYTDDSSIVKIVPQTQPVSSHNVDSTEINRSLNSSEDITFVNSNFSTSQADKSHSVPNDKLFTEAKTIINPDKLVLQNDVSKKKTDEERLEKIASDDYHLFMKRDSKQQRDMDGRSGYSRRPSGYGRPRGRHSGSNFEPGIFGLPNSLGALVKKFDKDIDKDFDFESSNALIADELANINFDDGCGDSSDKAAASQGTGESEDAVCTGTNKVYYDKKLSFFDNIGSDNKNINERRNERQLNYETFGGDSEKSNLSQRRYNQGFNQRGTRWGYPRYRGGMNNNGPGFARRGYGGRGGGFRWGGRGRHQSQFSQGNVPNAVFSGTNEDK